MAHKSGEYIKTLFEQLKSVRSTEEADAIISAHTIMAKRKPGDILNQFQMWIEYASYFYKLKVCRL